MDQSNGGSGTSGFSSACSRVRREAYVLAAEPQEQKQKSRAPSLDQAAYKSRAERWKAINLRQQRGGDVTEELQALRQNSRTTQGKTKWAAKPRKGRRAASFCRWLVDVFGERYLRFGGMEEQACTGIVDVAGGKGSLSFELHALRHIPCTVIDPRPPNFARVLRRFKAVACHPPDCASLHLPPTQPHQNMQRNDTTVDLFHLAWGRHRLLSSMPAFFARCFPLPHQTNDQLTLSSSDSSPHTPTQAEHSTHGKGMAGYGIGYFPSSLADDTESEISTQTRDKGDDEMLRLLRNCSMLVGLHPDQATEPLVDFALMHGKSFAVVPCCVFPRMFTHRSIPAEDGKGVQNVVTHEQLCQYIMAKDPRIKRQQLDFGGRNTVLFLQQECPSGVAK